MKQSSEIVKQSEAAYNQWAPLWRKNALEIADFCGRTYSPLTDFSGSGIGKFALLVGNGYSLEAEMETIKKRQGLVDIVACDKSLGHLLRAGIRPKFCLVADAVVSYEVYLEPYLKELSQTTLLMNICANPKWAKAPWKDRYFFLNEDAINSHLEFANISGCGNSIIASTNVSNMMLVMMTQCRNEGIANVFGYDRYLLIGYDYCWTNKGYYAFDKTGGGKANYMRHLFMDDIFGNQVYTSNNLLFSARWLNKYIKTFSIRAAQCSKTTLLPAAEVADLDKMMQYSYKVEDSKVVQNMLRLRQSIIEKMHEIDETLKNIEFDHFINTVKFC